jgi:hypothetical protein
VKTICSFEKVNSGKRRNEIVIFQTGIVKSEAGRFEKVRVKKIKHGLLKKMYQSGNY